ncbi:MAG: biotin--[acetyl-CoA-carboxylase] ligase [Candidatus Bipolaricaulota bacterium]|nr:biotin--[acetyl-CoA-carboxylase] ligase [Candidatus Bipolaricaulota bacterium]MDW8126190.1 biotin--[acetyl-CoA-carboxylase] ligase [Candidatus Bipolaricaulota bacterium]
MLKEEKGAGIAPGSLAPQHFLPRLRGKFGRHYRYLGVVSSTQDVLREWAGAAPGAVVAAEQQTCGRGRLGRRWESPPGNLYFSVLLTTEVDSLLPLRAGVALREAACVGKLKWPNDLLAPDGRKLAGILIERCGERVLLGVGINVEVAPFPTAAALSEFREVHRAQLLADFLWALEEWLAEKPELVLTTWKEANATLGKPLRVRVGEKVVEGVGVDIGPRGELLLRTSDGVCAVHAGEIETVNPG